MTFQVGQKVVCVDDAGQRGDWQKVVKGNVYVIRGFTSHPDADKNYYTGPTVVEISRVWRGVDCPFHASRFRPVVERKTSIECFTRMLTPKKQGVEA